MMRREITQYLVFVLCLKFDYDFGMILPGSIIYVLRERVQDTVTFGGS